MCLFVHFVMGLRGAREHSKPQFMQILQYSKRRKCWWLPFYWLGRNGTNCFSRYLCFSHAVYSYTHTYIRAYLRFYCCWRFCDSVPTRKISPKQIFCYSTSELLILLLHTVVSLQVWRCSSNWMLPAKTHTYAKVYLRATYTHTYIYASHASCFAEHSYAMAGNHLWKL